MVQEGRSKGRRAALHPLGPEPLLRHGAEGQLQLCPEGVALLRRVGAPVYVTFAIGGSRCGKSTTSNALVFGKDGGPGFATGSSFEPVTSGVDVAARPLPEGGTLVVADCEGAFHPCGSNQSARGFGALGLLAYALCSTLLHVSMGGVDERDVEVLGHLAAGAMGELCLTEDSKGQPDMLKPAGQIPSLILLVNGARFELGERVARKLLRSHGSREEGHERDSARRAIARAFRSNPVLEGLPSCDSGSYWDKVELLKRHILESSPALQPSGLQASGSDLADLAERLVGKLNNEEPERSTLREPSSATEVLLKQVHLEPLIEEISRRFAASGAVNCEKVPRVLQPLPHRPGEENKKDIEALLVGPRSVQEAMAEFDRRVDWLQSSNSGNSGDHAAGGRVGTLRPGLLKEVRGRLEARLEGISEALAKGHRLGSLRRPKGPRRRSPSSGAGSDAGVLSPTPLSEKENRTPTPPGTPSGKRSLRLLAVAVEEVERKTKDATIRWAEELKVMQASLGELQDLFVQAQEQAGADDQKAAGEAVAVQEHWRSLLAQVAKERSKGAGAQVAAATLALESLRKELQAVEVSMPDVRRCGALLDGVRSSMEAERVKRREATESAQKALEMRLRSLKESCETEASALTVLRGSVTRKLNERVDAVRRFLQEERQMRTERLAALTQVVERTRVSLEASAEEVEAADPCPPVALKWGTPEVNAKVRQKERTTSLVVTPSSRTWLMEGVK